jgi:NADH-quinone oxidoreductase subunit L
MHLVPFPLLALIPLFPLLGAAYCGLVGCRLFKKYGEGAIHLPAILLPWGSFVITVAAVITLAGAGPGAVLHQRLWDWFRIGSLSVDAAFQIDRLSAVMCLVVTFVGSLIHVYSRGYMKGDASYWRFFSNLNLFMFSMLVLVLGDNLLVMFVGWEGVGLCSYLLIGFWYRERKNAVAGMKAFVVNRVGDYGFTLGVFLLFWGLAAAPAGLLQGRGGEPAAATAVNGATTTAAPALAHGVNVAGEETHAPAGEPGVASGEHGSTAGEHGSGAGEHGVATGAHETGPTPVTSVTFREIERIMEDPARRDAVLNQKVLGLGLITLVCLLFFVGATGKSAQLPLYVWLPDAMAGPTPVSALIHAATMVTAGVYMVARLHFLFACSPVAMTVVATVGALTALFAATIGLFQYDIKKVLAYSTVSQLGFMFVAVGVGAYWVGIFHLVTHAFFKACLFLGSGSVILGCHHEQDMRRMGGLRKLMPITAVTYFLSACAIAGFPFFSGFFSKDEILWKAFDSGNMLLPGGGIILWVLAATAALCTSFYMFRSYYMTFSGAYRGAPAHGVADSQAVAGTPDAHDSHGGHGHGLPKESPRSMTWVLAVLGGLAVVGGYIGLPILWGLPNAFEKWLEPVFESSAILVRSAHRGHSAEWGLMLFSVVIALSGFFLARWLYKDAKSAIPGRLLHSGNELVRGFHRIVFNKYYVDEAYQASFVNGTVGLSGLLSWFDRTVIDGAVNLAGTAGKFCSSIQGWIDARVVDGAVNFVGSASMQAGRSLRRVQTGRIQNYVLGLTAGAVVLVVIGFLLKW